MADVVLVGMMGAGKSTVGRALADRLGADFVDSDEEVERATGQTVAQIWADAGEAAFRQMETRALAAALDGTRTRPAVVAAAGGVVLDPANRALLAHVADTAGAVVWLRARPETLAERVASRPGHRPLLGADPSEAAATLERLARERQRAYESVATLTVDVDDRDPLDVVASILGSIRPDGAPVGPVGPAGRAGRAGGAGGGTGGGTG